MSDKKTISVRVSAERAETLEHAAEELDVSRSDVVRLAIEAGLPLLEELPEHLEDEALYEQLRREVKPAQRRAWFRSNVAGQLWKAWNGGLSSDEVRDYLEGRRREAEELHEDPELLEYLEAGLAAYDEARQENESAVLKRFTNDRQGPDQAPEEPAPDAERPETIERPREEKVREAAAWVRAGSIDLEDVDEELRDDVAAALTEADGEIPDDPLGGGGGS